MRVLLMCALVALAAAPVMANVNDCSYTTPDGITYDFSKLIAGNGSYVWQQTSFVLDSKYNVFTSNPSFQETYYYEMQVCRNVQKSQFASCTEPSPLNRISQDGKTCERWGNLSIAGFFQNPFKDGAYLAMYAGDDVDHIHKYGARIYFQCNPNATEPRPFFEHQLTDYVAHMKFYTTIACKTKEDQLREDAGLPNPHLDEDVNWPSEW